MSYFIVASGTPYERGAILDLDLNENQALFGRKSHLGSPDICFDNVFVSRRHFIVFKENHEYYIEDLGSKHGTHINGVKVNPFSKTRLEHNDVITISNGIIKLNFTSFSTEYTLDFDEIDMGKVSENQSAFRLDPVKHEFVTDGKVMNFTPKEYNCFEYLFLNKDDFVSKEQLMKMVWPERVGSNGSVLEIGLEELNSILYRVRKKIAGQMSIHTVRGKGYELSITSNKETELV